MSSPPMSAGSSIPPLRADLTELGEGELARLAALNLPSPTDEELSQFLAGNHSHSPGHRAAESPPDAGGSSAERQGTNGEGGGEAHPAESALVEERPVTARWRRSASLLITERPSTSRPPTATSAASAVDDDDLSRAGRDAAYNVALSVLTKQSLVGGAEVVADAILSTRHVELIERQLLTAAPAELFLNATHVYLQYNRLSSLDGLEMLTQLQVLVVHHNHLTSVRAIATLDKLIYLDAGSNNLDTLNPAWDLPCASLQYLDLRGNRVCVADTDGEESAKYRDAIQKACTRLRILDGVSCQDGDGDNPSEEEEATGEREEARDDEEATDVARQEGNGSHTSSLPAGHRVRSRLDAARHSAKAQSAPPRHHSTSEVSLSAHAARTPAERVSLRPSSVPFSHQSIPGAPVAAASLRSAEERLLAQYETSLEAARQQRATLGADSGDDDTLSGRTSGKLKAADNDDSDVEATAGGSQLPSAAYAQTRKLHEDLAFATSAMHRRLGQSITDQWSVVDKVLQTRQAVVRERQRILRELPKTRSAAYEASLLLLADEGVSQDLDLYRKHDAA